jgi:ribosomal protein S18 acetylase RimI-like enzyme
VPASAYTVDQLAAIYNETRVDYIVPMPMTGRRMAEYIRDYDIDLDLSCVIVNAKDQGVALTMIGLRGDRAWATRLGVNPEYRGNKIGQFLMTALIKRSQEYGVRRVQLEVIKGNEPALRLFLKLGFAPTRELLTIRRAPGPLLIEPLATGAVINAFESGQITARLAERSIENAAWTEEIPSLLHAGGLKGLSAALPSGESGWIIFQQMPFQLTHLVFNPGVSADIAQALLHTVHEQFALHDTKVENLPSDDTTWPIFGRLGYMIAFARVEMVLDLTSSR